MELPEAAGLQVCGFALFKAAKGFRSEQHFREGYSYVQMQPRSGSNLSPKYLVDGKCCLDVMS